ncbi:proline--tRNA ligase [Candidatus Haliotispira prima]|uniref:Proline--tRNA ligase n=1 Tax=Candidatus Haliotispira prima TaxID=3034016 RepID=A0ABY8MG86_9SPIO|nr:proline--tRNA ligase [Candidatus Haliotispira prima]
MKMSRLIGQTRKEAPAGTSARSHELLLRGAYIHQVAAGIFSYLPLGQRLMQKISAILRREIEAIGGQEVNMPVAQPADLWQQSGRWYKIGAEMSRFIDRKGHDMALAMTHEETTGDLVHQFIQSYRDLPRLIYHLQTKWRDDPRPRAGLIRVREFVMKDSYSLDSSWEGLEQQYRNHYSAYFRIFDRCGLPVMAVLSDTGMMGGSIAHEFMYPGEVGEDTILFCPDKDCGYSANRQVAKFQKPVPVKEPLSPLEEVATPNCKSIAEVSQFLRVEPNHCAKMVFFVASLTYPEGQTRKQQQTQEQNGQKLVAAVLPGNMELNETKLTTLLNSLFGVRELRPAEEAEIAAAGAVAGYASPVGLQTEDCIVVADELIIAGSNWIGGANKEGFHVRGLNYGRDFEAQQVGDICAAAAEHPCPNCGKKMESTKAVEVGNIFQLGTFYSEAMDCYFTDESGQEKPIIMGSYGIGVGRLAACIAEQHNDEDGLIWPISVAPYQVHLLSLAGAKEPEAEKVAQQIYRDLQAAGIEVLFDDREERPGFKFKDADLIGIPIRLMIGKRSLENGGVEYRLRGRKQGKETPKTFWPVADVVNRTGMEIARLEEEIQSAVRNVEYRA